MWLGWTDDWHVHDMWLLTIDTSDNHRTFKISCQSSINTKIQYHGQAVKSNSVKKVKMTEEKVTSSPSKDRAEYSELLKKILAALFYGVSSFMIMVVNKRVLTNYHFPSFQVLGIGQMIATILILNIGKALKVINYPDLSTETFRKIWPLPLMYLGNMVFGLGGTQNLSLPMMTVLRRFSILMTMIGRYFKNQIKCGQKKWILYAKLNKTFALIRCYSLFLCAIVILGEFYILKVKPSTSVQLSVYLMILGSIVAAYNDLAFNLRG